MPNMEKRKLYLVTLVDFNTWEEQQVWVDTPCTHNMQEWINHSVESGYFDPPLTVQNPTVVSVQPYIVHLLPVTSSAC